MPKTFSASHLHAYMREILVASGATNPIADEVAEVLVGANLVGHDSHGLLRIPMYMRSIEGGRIVPDKTPEVIKDNGNAVVMDGHQGHGIFTCMEATRLAIRRAKEVGMCGITFKRIEHIGRLGHYAEMAAHEGCICFVTVGHGAAGKGSVLPYGSKAKTFNTNPIAYGIPTGDDTPFILDYATSVVAEGKLRVARSKELEVPDGTIVDKNTQPTNNPWDFYDGGALLPFGAHKGSALLMLPCLLGSLGGSFDPEAVRAQGCFIMVLDVSRFHDLEAYESTVRTFLDSVKATEPADGFDEVLVPGDFETRNRKYRLAHGIEVPDLILEELGEWDETFGISIGSATVSSEDEARYA